MLAVVQYLVKSYIYVRETGYRYDLVALMWASKKGILK